MIIDFVTPVRLRADLHPGDFKIFKSGRFILSQFGIGVDNRCDRLCEQGVCTSSCHYPIPIGADVRVYQLKNNKKYLKEFWYQGAVVPSRWSGISYGRAMPLQFMDLKKGNRFRVEATSNLDLNFKLALDFTPAGGGGGIDLSIFKNPDFSTSSSLGSMPGLGSLGRGVSSRTMGSIGAIGKFPTMTLGVMNPLMWEKLSQRCFLPYPDLSILQNLGRHIIKKYVPLMEVV